MTSCQCQGIEDLFNDKTARRELKHYRRKGALGLTRHLITFLDEQGVEGRSLLDIGGGIGAIQHELAERGAANVTNVDASSSYLSACRDEAAQRGYAERASYRHGDFTALADDVEAADIVTLDRVLCCYDDVEALVSKSAAKARMWYAVIYPRTDWWMQLVKHIPNIFAWITRASIRFFLHSTDHVDGLIRAAGFHIVHQETRNVWQLVIYSR